MGSKKRSAREREVAAFRAELDPAGMTGLFDAEHDREQQAAQHREDALRAKACERKKRYASRHEAELSAKACEAHGSPKLHAYKCPYCNGWHLTHKKPRG